MWLKRAIFAANEEYLVGIVLDGVRVWRVEDGKQITTMVAESARCLAVSQCDKWIAAGTDNIGVIMWDAKTYEQVLRYKDSDTPNILGVDFSPDSTRLVFATWLKATVWDIATCKQAHTLHHHGHGWVKTVQYSPQGDRIATASHDSVHVWDSNNGGLLLEIPVTVTPEFNQGLRWFNTHLFILSKSTLKQFDASTGSVVAQWPVSESNSLSCITLPKNVEFIAYSTNSTITFWDTSTHTQLGLVQYPEVNSIAISPAVRFSQLVEGNSASKAYLISS
ncbi:WD40-repeat-containing domain protein [Boletus reticuloceps]|uniref:WD40-repeat-containing domain protein n=1 Tax=Boletus reticuloceps TaxID=495285 RepID=A0A8I3A833_9AGAM|nr:WD40-repeat-containing domain protein [Boletus reticuloceps]